jgi:hypothetical protein
MSIVKGAAVAAIVATSMSLPAVSMAHTSRDRGTATHKELYYNNTAHKPAVVNHPNSGATPRSEPWFLDDHNTNGGVG